MTMRQRAALAWRSPPRLSRCRSVLPEEAGIGWRRTGRRRRLRSWSRSGLSPAVISSGRRCRGRRRSCASRSGCGAAVTQASSRRRDLGDLGGRGAGSAGRARRSASLAAVGGSSSARRTRRSAAGADQLWCRSRRRSWSRRSSGAVTTSWRGAGCAPAVRAFIALRWLGFQGAQASTGAVRALGVAGAPSPAARPGPRRWRRRRRTCRARRRICRFGPVDLDHLHAGSGEVAGELGPVGAGALDPDPVQLSVRAQPAPTAWALPRPVAGTRTWHGPSRRPCSSRAQPGCGCRRGCPRPRRSTLRRTSPW